MMDPGYIGNLPTPLNNESKIALAARSGGTYYFRTFGGGSGRTIRYFIQATYAPSSVQSLVLGASCKPTLSSNGIAWLQFPVTAGKSYTLNLQDHATSSSSYGREVTLTAYVGSPAQIWGTIDHVASSRFPISVASVPLSGIVSVGFDTTAVYNTTSDPCAVQVDEH